MDVFDYAMDAVGLRWFRISSQGLSGYVQARELAPPKGTTPEGGFMLFRYSLLALEDPAVLPEAAEAVAYYQKAFPGSPYGEEVTWLLAERTRQLAERSARPQALLQRARELYEKIALQNGAFAEQARQALTQVPKGKEELRPRRSSSPSPSPLQFSVVGGTLTPSQAPPPGSAGAPIRTLTVLNRTLLLVRLTEPAPSSPAVAFQGEIEQDIRVNNQIAIPKGSACHMTIEEAPNTTGRPRTVSSITLRLHALVVDNQTYAVSAVAVVRIAPPPRSDSPSSDSSATPQLGAGTRALFQLDAPLVITRS